MITHTIREAIVDESETIPGYVYVVRDGEVIFYVGMSNDPTFRLCQHLGIAGRDNYLYPPESLIQEMENGCALSRDSFGSPVGMTILENAPGSLEWSFDIYEKEDALAAIRRIRTDIVQALPQMLEMMEVDWYEQRTIVENALIAELRPYLNRTGKRYRNPLPEKYTKRKIASGGAILM